MWEEIKNLVKKDEAEKVHEIRLKEIADSDSSNVTKIYKTIKETLEFRFKDVTIIQVDDVSTAEETHYVFVNGSLIMLLEIVDGGEEYESAIHTNFHVKCLPTTSVIIYKHLDDALKDLCYVAVGSVFYNKTHKLHGDESLFGKEAIKAYTDDNHKKALKKQREIDLAAYEAGYSSLEEMN